MRLFTFTLIIFGLSIFGSYGQGYMDDIAQQACECISEMDGEMLRTEEGATQMGICMLVEAQKYSRKIKRDFGLDMSNIGENGEQLGEIVGMRMVQFCPEALIAMAEYTSQDNEVNSDPEHEQFKKLSGEIVGIEDTQFVIFTVEDENGKRTRLVWMESFPNEFGLEDNYMGLKNEEVIVNYVAREYYDPRISQYRKFKVLQSIATIQE